MSPYSVSFSVQDIPDLSGKVVIITGLAITTTTPVKFADTARGATGIGKETALQCFRRNAKVYIASRSRAKFDALTRELETSSVRSENDPISLGSLEFLPLDLMDIKDCIRAAKEFVSKEQRLDVVIANAALAVAVGALDMSNVDLVVS
jgi:retinol dehydrogenase-12